jgi:hypothetical protein
VEDHERQHKPLGAAWTRRREPTTRRRR